jgi:hypothetical protein
MERLGLPPSGGIVTTAREEAEAALAEYDDYGVRKTRMYHALRALLAETEGAS